MIAVPLRKSVARIWLWFDDEPTDDIPPINRWRFDIETPKETVTFGEQVIPEVGAMGLGIEYKTAGEALDAAMKWCGDRGLELIVLEFSFNVYKKLGTS